MNAVTLSEMKQDVDKVFDYVDSALDPTIVIGENGKKFVIMPLAEFNAWQETAHVLSNPANVAELEKSLAELRNGHIEAHELIES